MALPFGNPLQDPFMAQLEWLRRQQQVAPPPEPVSDIPEPGPVLRATQPPLGVPGESGPPALPQALAQVQEPAAAPRVRALPKTLGSVTNTAATAPAAPTAAAGAPPMPAPTAPGPAREPSATGVSKDPYAAMEESYRRADEMRNAAFDKLTPSEADLEGYRRTGTLGQLAGLSMQLLGNEPQQAVGGNVLKQSMAELEKGKRDPWKVGEMEAKKLDAQAAALEKRAQFAVTIEEKREAQRQANELKAQAMQLRGDIAQASLQMRGMTAGLAQENQQERQRQMIFQREHTLRSDYSKATKDITDGQRAAQQILSIVPAQVEKMNAQEQMALIFSFMRMLDPGSVVREAEYASAAKARGVLDTIGNYTTYLQSGKPLTPTQVRNMAGLGRTLMEAMGELKRDINTQFESTARGWGVDPKNFVTGATLRAPGPQPGANRATDVPAVPRDAPVDERAESYLNPGRR